MRVVDREPSLLIDRREAARLLDISVRGLINLEKKGVFHPLKLGTSVKYRRANIESRLAELASQAGGGVGAA